MWAKTYDRKNVSWVTEPVTIVIASPPYLAVQEEREEPVCVLSLLSVCTVVSHKFVCHCVRKWTCGIRACKNGQLREFQGHFATVGGPADSRHQSSEQFTDWSRAVLPHTEQHTWAVWSFSDSVKFASHNALLCVEHHLKKHKALICISLNVHKAACQRG